MNKLGRMLLLLLSWFIVCGLMYLIGAWTQWNLDPEEWSSMSRGVIALAASFLLVILVARCAEISSEQQTRPIGHNSKSR